MFFGINFVSKSTEDIADCQGMMKNEVLVWIPDIIVMRESTNIRQKQKSKTKDAMNENQINCLKYEDRN